MQSELPFMANFRYSVPMQSLFAEERHNITLSCLGSFTFGYIHGGLLLRRGRLIFGE